MSHRTEEARSRRRRWVAGAIATGVIAALVVVAAGQSGGGTAASEKPKAALANDPAPGFAAVDVVSGRTMRLRDLRGKPTLLFFSEGASCQACLVQIAELQKSKALAERGIALVSVTTDAPDVLREAAAGYRIRTPLLSDPSARMSADYAMLGHGGMGHPQSDGHAFALVANGRVVWHKAYAEMFVPAGRLIGDLDRRAA